MAAAKDDGGYGKFRKRPFRRITNTTPYDRPQISIPTNTTPANNGWLSRLVDPAHRLIASSAHKLFASLLRKRLPPPPPEINEGAVNKRVEAVPPSTDSLDARVAIVSGGDTPSTSYAKDGLTDLELILKQKTFTRSEIDRLTALLQSRTVDLDAGGEEKKSEVVALNFLSSLDRKEITNTPVKENGTGNQLVSTPNVSSTVLDEDVASPAELAKAYMGSRSSKLSPPMLGSQSQILRGDNAALIPFPSKSSIMSLVPKSSGHSGFPENGYVTPRSRGRSAIYSMARTPYSRVRSAANVQDHRTRVDAFGGPSSSQSALDLENNRFSGSKQGALKRRSSVFDNDIGSAGPIRRIRQKSNLLPVSGSLAIRGTGVATGQNLSSTKKLASAGESSRENVENSLHGSDLITVPSKSSQVASKILQQLDVLVSSREKSPTKLSPSMLRGPALRSLENVDSSKFLDTVPNNNKLDVKNDISMCNTPDFIFQKMDKEQNGPTKFISDKSSAATVSQNVFDSVSDATAAAISSIQPSSQKHWAFQMSAPEDMLEVDDDDNFNAPKSSIVAERKGKLDITNNKPNVTEVITMKKTSVFPDIGRAGSSLVNEKTTGTFEAPVAAEKGSGSTFSKSPLSSITPQQQVLVNGLSTVKSDKAVELKDASSTPPVFTCTEQPVSEKQANGTFSTADFGHKADDKITKSTWASSSSNFSEPAAVKSASPNQISESSSSFAFSAGATESVVKKSESGRADEKKSSKDRVVFMSPESVSAAGSTSSIGLFSFGTPANGSALNNGLLAPTLFSSSSALQGSDNGSSKVPSPGSNASLFANISSSVTPTFSVDTTNANSLSASATTQSAAPILMFSSSVSSTSPVTESSTVGVEKSESKTKETNNSSAKTVPVGAPSAAVNTGTTIFGGASCGIAGPGSSMFGNSSSAAMGSGSSPFSATSAALPSTGSSIFSFNAGTTTSVSVSQSQGFNPFTAGSAQASEPGTVVATSSPSMVSQFGSSSSGPLFGLTGSTGSSGGSMFTSSSKPLSAVATFGPTSSSSDTGAVGSSSNVGSTIFSSSWQGPNSSIFGQTVGSSSTPTSTATSVFSFAASSTSNTTSSSPLVFESSSNASGVSSTSGGATGSPFVFGSTSNAFGASSTSKATSSSPVVFPFSSSSASSGSIFPFSSSSATTPLQPVFGNPTPSFPFGALPSPSGNNDQMSMEDSMAEDTVQATTPAVSAFNQQPASSPSFIFGTPPSTGGIPFGATAPSGANPFQLGGQPNMGFTTPQNPSQFQASSSLGGSFSLGTGGGDKTGRRIVKVKKPLRKK